MQTMATDTAHPVGTKRTSNFDTAVTSKKRRTNGGDELQHKHTSTAIEERDSSPPNLGEDCGCSSHDGQTKVRRHDERHRSTLKTLARTQKAVSRSGVIYLSRVPPFMKVHTLKHLLSPYGDIGRIFLTPEDPKKYSRRVKSGGNKKRSFVDGWVEFVDKQKAKLVAQTLNAEIIGGKKGGWYHDDIWNIKYLKGFKWHNLTEQIAAENAARADRLRRDLAQSKRTTQQFLQNVEKAKIYTTMKSRQAKRGPSPDRALGTDDQASRPARPGHRIAQNEGFRKAGADGSEPVSDLAKGVLSKIF